MCRWLPFQYSIQLYVKPRGVGEGGGPLFVLGPVVGCEICAKPLSSWEGVGSVKMMERNSKRRDGFFPGNIDVPPPPQPPPSEILVTLLCLSFFYRKRSGI